MWHECTGLGLHFYFSQLLFPHSDSYSKWTSANCAPGLFPEKIKISENITMGFALKRNNNFRFGLKIELNNCCITPLLSNYITGRKSSNNPIAGFRLLIYSFCDKIRTLWALIMTGCLAAKWGLIQNGGQGQNSIPLASATDPDPMLFHAHSLLYVFTTGYRRLAFIISSETQSASNGQLPRRGGPSLTWRYLPACAQRLGAQPVGTAFTMKPWRNVHV